MGWERRYAFLVDFCHEPGGEFETVDEGFCLGALDAAIGHGVEDFDDGGEDAVFVPNRRELELLGYGRTRLGIFEWKLRIVMAAKRGAADRGRVAGLAGGERVSAVCRHDGSLKINGQWTVRLCLFRVRVVNLLSSQRRFSTPRTKTCPWGPRCAT